MLTKTLNLSLSRMFIFLFFNCIYAFLTFWIGSTLFLFFPFAIVGFFMYLFVLVFHKAVISITEKFQDSKNIQTKKPVFSIFFVFLILFCLSYLAVVYFLQKNIINNFSVPETVFSAVSWFLTLVSLVISFFFSFVNKVKK